LNISDIINVLKIKAVSNRLDPELACGREPSKRAKVA
jgi:hypothetical protein